MTARPRISALPSAGLSPDGIVDVLGGRSIVIRMEVGSTNDFVLKGQALEADGASGSVKYAEQNATYDNFRGVAVSSALSDDQASVLRVGIARMVYGISTNLVVGAGVAIWGYGKVCAVGEIGEDESSPTTNTVGYVSEVGSGYVDVEMDMFGEEQHEYSDSSKLSVSSESSDSSDSSLLSVSSESSSESKLSVSSESSNSSESSVSSDSSTSSTA